MNGLTDPTATPDIAMEEQVVDTLAPAYQQLLDQGFSIATTKDEAALESWYQTAPKEQQQQLLDDVESLLHSHKVFLIKSLFGLEAIKRLSRGQKDKVLQIIAHASAVDETNRFLQAVDPALYIQPSVSLKSWSDYAVRIAHGLDIVRSLQVKPQLQQHQEYLDRFRSMHPATLQDMRKRLEGAFLEMKPGEPLDKTTIDKLGNVLAKAGFPQQVVKELTSPGNRLRLLQTVNKIYTPLAVTEQHFGNPNAQEAALRQRLQQMQNRYGPSW